MTAGSILQKFRKVEMILLALLIYIKYKEAMGTTKKKMGRPPLPPEKRRSKIVMLRLTDEEAKFLKSAAEKTGLTLSEVLRRGGLEYGKRLQARRQGKP